jgi:hypothetical protein
MSSTASGKKEKAAPAIDTDSVKRGIEWLDKMMAGLWQRNDEAKKAIESDTEDLHAVDHEISMDQQKLRALQKDRWGLYKLNPVDP